jgi:hypothetical protein
MRAETRDFSYPSVYLLLWTETYKLEIMIHNISWRIIKQLKNFYSSDDINNVDFLVWRPELQMCGHPRVFLQVDGEIDEQNVVFTLKVEEVSIYKYILGQNQYLDISI